MSEAGSRASRWATWFNDDDSELGLHLQARGFSRVELFQNDDRTWCLRCCLPQRDGRQPRFRSIAMRMGEDWLDMDRGLTDAMLFAFDDDVQGRWFNHGINCRGELMFFWVATSRYGDPMERYITEIDWKECIRHALDRAGVQKESPTIDGKTQGETTRNAMEARTLRIAKSRGLLVPETLFMGRRESCIRCVLPSGHGLNNWDNSKKIFHAVIRWGHCTDYLYQALENMMNFTDHRSEFRRDKNHALDVNGRLIYFWMESDYPGDESEFWLSGSRWREYMW